MRASIVGLSLLLAVPVIAAAAPPVRNAKVSTRAGGADPAATVRSLASSSGEAAWIGWVLPSEHKRQMCCYEDVARAQGGGPSGCRLEGRGSFTIGANGSTGSGILEPQLVVLVRAENGAMGRVTVLSEDCAIDGGGRALHWVLGVTPAASLAILSSMLDGRSSATGKKDHALMAIAMHPGPAADALLARYAAPGQPRELRKKAAFWMGNERGRAGFDALAKIIATDQDDDFRSEAMFAISQSDVPEAQQLLIRSARHDQSSEVREKALFWLSQKAGDKAVEAIVGAIRDDPDEDVKEKAVFALSQLPKDQGIPLLIQTAKTNRNPEVRKKALFWLGQSGDPRALEYIEAVLTK